MKTSKLFIIIGLAFFAFACQMMQQAASPTDTFKAYVEAIKKKDAAAAKQLASKNSLKMMEEAAKAQNKSVDELLTTESPALKETLETRNEKIQGDTATLEIKNSVSGSWDTMHFVKEDGRWKLAFDKMMEEMMKKVEEQMKNFNQSMPGDGDDKDDLSPSNSDKKKE